MTTIVVGVCERERSRPALSYAALLAERSGAEVVAVHARRAPAVGSPALYDIGAVVRTWGEECEMEAFLQAVAVLQDRVPRWRFEVRPGRVTAVLCAAALREEAGIIVIGASRSRRRALVRALAGGPAAATAVLQPRAGRADDTTKPIQPKA